MTPRFLPCYLTLAALLAASLVQACPTPPPVVLHSTFVSACSKEPARSAIGCTMYRLCQNATLKTPIFPKLCDNWRIASSLCSDDTAIATSVGFCTQLRALFSNETEFKSCMQPYPISSTSYARNSIIGDCHEMAEYQDTMLGCDSCTKSYCPDPLESYSLGCYSMDMGKCVPWIKFCKYDTVYGAAPNGDGAVVLCKPFATGVTAPPRAPSPPPEVAPTNPPPAGLTSCIANPTQPSCASYEYPAANISADLNKLCAAMPFMPGCTVMFACQAGRVTGDFCRPMTLLATICLDMPGMAGCGNYRVMCGSGTVIKQCQEFPAVPGIPTTKQATDAVTRICSGGMMMRPSQCDTCDGFACDDYLSGLIGMCQYMPGRPGCEVMTSFCAASAAWQQGASNISYYCKAFTSSPPPAVPSCVSNPTQLQCAPYVYPAANIAADVAKLCMAMPYMPGCTILYACRDRLVSGPACNNMTLLATICYDMPGMSGCSSYVPMCRTNGTLVQQCSQSPAIPGLPTTMAARAVVTGLCDADPTAKQCDTCNTLSCDDYLVAVSGICRGGNTAPGCANNYTSWCRTLTTSGAGNFSYYCPGFTPKPPSPRPPKPSPPKPNSSKPSPPKASPPKPSSPKPSSSKPSPPKARPPKPSPPKPSSPKPSPPKARPPKPSPPKPSSSKPSPPKSSPPKPSPSISRPPSKTPPPSPRPSPPPKR